MDISKVPDSSSPLTSRQLSQAELFRQITQLGSVEAKVASIEKGRALLLTRLGQIISSNSLDLKQGDRLSLRTGDDPQKPTLKITKLPISATRLSSASNPVLNQSLPTGKAISALIIGHQANKSIIQLGRQQISIQPPVNMKTGQLLSLTKLPGNQSIELRPVNHPQVLKSALSQLLPQQVRPQQPAALTQLTKLIQATITVQSASTNESQQTIPVTKISSTPAKSAQTATTPQSASLLSQLQSLLNAVPQLSTLDKKTVEQWVRYIITTGQDREPDAQRKQNPYQLLQQLPKSEALVAQQLRQFAAQTIQANNADIETSVKFDEAFQTIGKEIVKLVEQSASQQLLQQTNLRLQQELQLPLGLNIAIPLADQQKNQELRLRIQQRNSRADAESQSWDIHLDFEFGLLGLISTHLLLDDNKLSASFWSQEPTTRDKIENQMDHFKQQLTRAGYDLGQFHSFPGTPPKESVHDAMTMPETLLDIRV